MSDDATTLPPAAWYADPQDPNGLRYWDGRQWTDQTHAMAPHEAAAPEAPAPEATVSEAVPQDSAGVEAVVTVDTEPAATDEREQLYPGFAAEVAALQPEASESAAAAGPVAAVVSDVLLVTTDDIPGQRVVSVIGQVFGVAVRARSDFGAGGSEYGGMFRGGASGDHAELLQRTRQEAVDRLIAEAAGAGANAVVAMRFDSSEIADLMTEIAVYGTAVVARQE